MSLLGIVEAQRALLVRRLPLAAGGVRDLHDGGGRRSSPRPPFDMPVADSEIIFGAYTEYTGLKFAFFLLSEYGGIVVMSAIAAVLYLGGYQPLPGLRVHPWVRSGCSARSSRCRS